MGEGAKQARAGTIEGNPENKTSTTNKMPQTCEVEHQEEGGEAMPDRANKTTPPSADIVANSANSDLLLADGKKTGCSSSILTR